MKSPVAVYQRVDKPDEYIITFVFDINGFAESTKFDINIDVVLYKMFPSHLGFNQQTADVVWNFGTWLISHLNTKWWQHPYDAWLYRFISLNEEQINNIENLFYKYIELLKPIKQDTFF